MRVWNIKEEKGELVERFEKVHEVTIKTIAVSSNGKFVVSGADDREVAIRLISL